jgi:inosine triphosphate pyrophosphatase
MKSVTFITGNQNKADQLAEYLGTAIDHHKLDLDEIQSLDLRAIVDHKVRQAYQIIGSPVIVEDTSLEFTAFGRLPGPFIKFFVDEIPLESICRLLDHTDRSAVARSVYGYFDGTEPHIAMGALSGKIADHPAGDGGFGWDAIFIPEGYSVTRSQMSAADYIATFEKIKPTSKLKSFFK